MSTFQALFLLCSFGWVASQSPALISDEDGVTIQISTGTKLYVQEGQQNPQEVVFKQQLDEVQARLDDLTNKFDLMSNQVTDLLKLPNRVTKVETDVIDLTGRVDTLEAVTKSPTPAPTPSPTFSPIESPTLSPSFAPSVSPTPLSCTDGIVNGTKDGCPKWRKVTAADVIDVKTFNVNITIYMDPDDDQNVVVNSLPTARGCGTDFLRGHSSMGVYIGGAWTKMRYRMNFKGRTSCYSIFGGNRFNEHEHTSLLDLDPGREYVDNVANADLGAEMGGMFEYDPKIDSILSSSDSVVQVGIDTLNKEGGDHCNSNPSLWSINTDVERSISVELRRHYMLYEGVKQYDPTAGPSAGATCISLGGMSWSFDNMWILV